MNITLFQAYAHDLVNANVTGDAVIHMNVDQTSLSNVKWQKLGTRQTDFKEQNKFIRQALADSLRSTFGVTDMKKLPKSVLDVLKLGDFQLDKHGKVTSERPLTARRLIAITDAVAAWQTACQEVKAGLAGRKIITGSSSPNEDAQKLDRLFDSERLLPSTLKRATLTHAANLMFGMQVKPYQVRLALECVAKLDAAGIKVPTSGSAVSKLNKLAHQIGAVVGPAIFALRQKIETYEIEKGKNPGANLPVPDFVKDGVKGTVGTDEALSVMHLVNLLLQKQNPSVANLMNGAKDIDFDELGDSISQIRDESLPYGMEFLRLTDLVKTQPPNSPQRAQTGKMLNAAAERQFTYTAIENTLKDLCVQARGIDILPQRTNTQVPDARPVDPKAFPEIASRFNASGKVMLSPDELFVTNGKTGLANAPAQVQNVFANVDLTTYAVRAQKIANSIVQYNVASEMAKGMTGQLSQYEKDFYRTTLFLNGNDYLMPNKANTPEQKAKMDNDFAVYLKKTPTATYETLSAHEKAKVTLMKSMLNQYFESLPQMCLNVAMTPNGDRSTVNNIGVPTQGQDGKESVYKFSFDDDGGMTATVYRSIVGSNEIECGFDAQFNANPGYEAKEPIRTTTRVDMHISPEEVDRFISQDWSQFNVTEVDSAYSNYDNGNLTEEQRVPNFYANFADNHIPENYRLNIDTSISVQYEING